jgi:hypothetical protein
MFLGSEMLSFLVDLDRARLDSQDGWVPSSSVRHYTTFTRTQAQKAGYVEGRGSTSQREYCITKAGRTALADNAQAHLDEMQRVENGFVPTDETDPAAAPVTAKRQYTKRASTKVRALELASPNPPVSEIVIAATPITAITTEKNNARVQACVQAIDILAESFPEVTDLVDALVKINERKGRSYEDR